MRLTVDGLPLLLGEGGIAVYLRALLPALVTEAPEHEYVLWFRGVRKQIRIQVERLRLNPKLALFAFRLTRLPGRLFDAAWSRGSWYLPGTERWLGSPDCFLSTSHLTPVPVLRRGTVVMVVHDLIPLRFPEFYGQDQSLLRQRLQRGIERAAAIIVASESTKRDLLELFGVDPGRIHVIYHGVDARFGPRLDETELHAVLERYRIRKPYLLYVGSLEPRKNVAVLVRSFRRLRYQHRFPHQLVLCGPTRFGADVVTEARDLLAPEDYRILGVVPDRDLPALYQGAEAFVFPSLYEGFGLPPLEAMACGVPVVASNSSSLPEVIGDSGLLVPPNDEEALEAALLQILTDSELRQTLRSRGLQRAARFRWEETARQTLKVVKLVGTEVF